MPGLERQPTIRIVDDPVDAVIGIIELSPILDGSGEVVDHLVTRADGAGATLLFGELPTLRSRRIGELDRTRAAFVGQLLGHVTPSRSSTVELRIADRRMLVHVIGADRVVTIVFARVDMAATAEAANGDERMERLRTMMAQFTDGVAMYRPERDADGAIVDFVCLEMSDADPLLPAHEQIGRRLRELYPETIDNGTFDGYVRAISTGEPWNPDPIVYRRDDQRYVYRLTAQAIDDDLVVSWHDTLVDVEPSGDRPSGEALTSRQREILQSIADGRSTADIAGALFLSPYTIRNEVRRILAKLGVRTRAEAVNLAHVRDLIARNPRPS